MLTVYYALHPGLMKFLAKGRTDRIIVDREEKLNVLLRTFKHNLHNKYNRYAFIFFLCELLNVVIAVGQVNIIEACDIVI